MLNFVLKNVDGPMLFWEKLKKKTFVLEKLLNCFFVFFLAVYVIFDLALYEVFAVFVGYKHLNAGMNWKLSECRNFAGYKHMLFCAGKDCMINV